MKNESKYMRRLARCSMKELAAQRDHVKATAPRRGASFMLACIAQAILMKAGL